MAHPVKYQGVDKESSGYKLLAAMGWQEGSGLGARQQGIKEHVRVKKKHDVTGVGALEAVAKARDWTAGMAAYDLVLAKMKPLSAAQDAFQQEPSIKASKKKRKQPEPTEAPAAAAAVPQPQSATAKASKSKTKKVKKQRNAAADSATVPSSAAASQAPQPLAITAAAMVTAPKATTSAQQAKGRHVGRYHRVTSAKKAKGYSSSDLAAILGVEALPVAVPTAVTATPAAAQESSEDTCYQPDEPAVLATQPSSDLEMQQQAESRQQEETQQELEPEPADLGKQWWHGTFVKAGRMGNMADDVLQHGPDKEVKINGFSEQDQENLYMATQLGKTSGKKGLGKSTQPKDIGGVKWAGKKTLLEDADNQNADHSNETTLAAADDHNIAQAADTRQASTGEPADGFQHCASGIKWKRKAKQLLSQAPAGKMKVKKLQKQLLQQSSYPEATWASLGSQLVAQLAASKQFKLTQSSVMLVQ